MTRSALRRGAVAALTVACIDAAFATTATYKCSEGVSLTARFSPPSYATGQVELTFGNGRSLTLPQVMAADGGRYAAGDVEFWIKGNGATLRRGGSTQSCSTR
ncbi:MliC family protein [Bosea sp. BH3]|uniref:MliC family protein n=1 Tax=Bosea sp. BH3 TaxID=2871701 RepID=UPI0021CB4C80|nr:MliC family protein [Bosea sp. BH3]MCU4179093.1 MliC family protein [Bosea sp. BH3]